MYKLFFNSVELLIPCYAYLGGSDLLMLIFAIFADLVKIIGIICRKKYELLHNLKYILNYFEIGMELYENYMEISMKLYENYMEIICKLYVNYMKMI